MRGGVFFYREICISPVKARFFLFSDRAAPPPDFPCRPQGKPSVAETPTRVGLQKNRCCGITFLRKQKLALRHTPSRKAVSPY